MPLCTPRLALRPCPVPLRSDMRFSSEHVDSFRPAPAHDDGAEQSLLASSISRRKAPRSRNRTRLWHGCRERTALHSALVYSTLDPARESCGRILECREVYGIFPSPAGISSVSQLCSKFRSSSVATAFFNCFSRGAVRSAKHFSTTGVVISGLLAACFARYHYAADAPRVSENLSCRYPSEKSVCTYSVVLRGAMGPESSGARWSAGAPGRMKFPRSSKYK